MSLARVESANPRSAAGQLYTAARPGGAGWRGAGGVGDRVGYDQNKVRGHPDRDALDRVGDPGRRVGGGTTSGQQKTTK